MKMRSRRTVGWHKAEPVRNPLIASWSTGGMMYHPLGGNIAMKLRALRKQSKNYDAIMKSPAMFANVVAGYYFTPVGRGDRR